MVSDVNAAARLCDVDDAGRAPLVGRRRPVVLLPRRADAAVAAQVAPGNRQLGVLLPYTPPGTSPRCRCRVGRPRSGSRGGRPWRMAVAYLDMAYDGATPAGTDVARRNVAHWADVLAIARGGVNSPRTSSAGRLFDAVSAVVGVRDTVN